jgi:exonuclease VII large subunit
MRSVADVEVGEAITTQVEDGRLVSSVKELKKEDGEDNGR